MTQLAITARDNKNLFSNYYLDNQIKNNPEWKKEEHKDAFTEIKKLYDIEKDHIPTLNEKQLEQRFFGRFLKSSNIQLRSMKAQIRENSRIMLFSRIKPLLMMPIKRWVIRSITMPSR